MCVQIIGLCLVAAAFAPLSFLSAGEPYPLPLASSWNTGQLPTGFTPSWQMDQIDNGHHLLLTMSVNGPDGEFTQNVEEYLGAALRRASAKRVPISSISADWDYPLYASDRYFNVPADQRPVPKSCDSGYKRRTLSFAYDRAVRGRCPTE